MERGVSNIRSATSVACALVSLLACGGCADPATDITTPHEGGDSRTLDPHAVQDAAVLCAKGTASGPTERWLQSFGDDDIFELSSIAVDAQSNALLARSVGETLKFDPNGALLWSRHFGSLVAVKADTNVTVAGTFTGTLELGPQTLTSMGGTDVYVAKLDSNGTALYRSEEHTS